VISRLGRGMLSKDKFFPCVKELLVIFVEVYMKRFLSYGFARTGFVWSYY